VNGPAELNGPVAAAVVNGPGVVNGPVAAAVLIGPLLSIVIDIIRVFLSSS
jgi:hypothetical protein